jgi:quercetin dioxygenase-like cupin family protein
MNEIGAKPPPQRFVVSHARDADWERGLRPFFEYRDLGVAAATGGRYHAHIIRAREPTTEGTGRHFHDLDFQIAFVLKGWARFHYEGQGEVLMEPGSCVLQPPGIRHDLLECSADLELLEVTSPADFGSHDADG